MNSSIPDKDKLVQARDKIKAILLDNIVPFWYPQTIDRDQGGYRLNHDVQGVYRGSSNKGLVTQSRTVWFFARLVRAELGGDEHLEAAAHGFQFLRDRLWDAEHGGLFWMVDAAGTKAIQSGKHMYGQSFGLYSLSEYAMAAEDEEAKHLAHRLLKLMEYHAHDQQYGGYREMFNADWSTPPDDETNYMAVPNAYKLMNTHLHLLEAFTTFYRLTRDPLARQRLIELIFIQSNSVVRKTIGACTDKYSRDWTPIDRPEYNRVSYGHDVENVWLLMDACDAVGIPNSSLSDLYQTLMNYSLRYGYDHRAGGFYDTGEFEQPADRLDKIWWVQAEGIVAFLRMALLTGQTAYWDRFFQILDWIDNHQTDWKNGDWFATVQPDGTVSGDKAGVWKSPYHNGRAMIECFEILQKLR